MAKQTENTKPQNVTITIRVPVLSEPEVLAIIRRSLQKGRQ